jgi:hypothetical protein
METTKESLVQQLTIPLLQVYPCMCVYVSVYVCVCVCQCSSSPYTLYTPMQGTLKYLNYADITTQLCIKPNIYILKYLLNPLIILSFYPFYTYAGHPQVPLLR